MVIISTLTIFQHSHVTGYDVGVRKIVFLICCPGFVLLLFLKVFCLFFVAGFVNLTQARAVFLNFSNAAIL